MDKTTKKEYIKALEQMLEVFYELFGFIHLSNYLKTENMLVSHHTCEKVNELFEFIFEVYPNLLIEMDTAYFINKNDEIPKWEKTDEGVFKFKKKQLVKFLCYHIWVMEKQLSNLKGGAVGMFHESH